MGPGETAGQTHREHPDCAWTGVDLANEWDMVPTDSMTAAYWVSAVFISFHFDLLSESPLRIRVLLRDVPDGMNRFVRKKNKDRDKPCRNDTCGRAAG